MFRSFLAVTEQGKHWNGPLCWVPFIWQGTLHFLSLNWTSLVQNCSLKIMGFNRRQNITWRIWNIFPCILEDNLPTSSYHTSLKHPTDYGFIQQQLYQSNRKQFYLKRWILVELLGQAGSAMKTGNRILLAASDIDLVFGQTEIMQRKIMQKDNYLYMKQNQNKTGL